MATKGETVIAALAAQISAYFSDDWGGAEVAVLRNAALPELVPAGGLIIIRDGDPGEEVEPLLDQQGPYYFQHTPEIEIYVEEADQSARDALFTDLVAGCGSALELDLTLGGEIFGMDYGPAEPITTPVDGADDLKSAVIKPVLDYASSTRL